MRALIIPSVWCVCVLEWGLAACMDLSGKYEVVIDDDHRGGPSNKQFMTLTQNGCDGQWFMHQGSHSGLYTVSGSDPHIDVIVNWGSPIGNQRITQYSTSGNLTITWENGAKFVRVPCSLDSIVEGHYTFDGGDVNMTQTGACVGTWIGTYNNSNVQYTGRYTIHEDDPRPVVLHTDNIQKVLARGEVDESGTTTVIRWDNDVIYTKMLSAPPLTTENATTIATCLDLSGEYNVKYPNGVISHGHVTLEQTGCSGAHVLALSLPYTVTGSEITLRALNNFVLHGVAEQSDGRTTITWADGRKYIPKARRMQAMQTAVLGHAADIEREIPSCERATAKLWSHNQKGIH